MKKTRILLADDHEMIRDGLRAVLEKVKEFEIVAEAANGQELLEKIVPAQPDVVLLDITMPLLNGMETAKELQENFPGIKVIMLTMHDNVEYILKCIEYGVMGYVLKNEGGKEIIRAINDVSEGKKYYSEIVTNAILENYKQEIKRSNKPNKVQLEITHREQEILVYITQGFTNQKIADKLFISFRTVETHRSNLMRKLDVKNSIELVNKARELNLIK
jgi:DNA-binding NarL/FixJ family response regulator